MRIDKIRVELEPWILSDGNISMHLEMTVNGRKLQTQEIYMRDDFESMVDVYFRILAERIKQMLKEQPCELEGEG